ncbi:hypothetical protein EVAR_64876_1 [Eumeta japonica]|uniref:Uncharacterized protein n=1 Tax=Eumeta variegata TaxID=151549 RepID=A0A4C2A8H2_EUMVA|nr:hypothetical protein EVAR_64876_1 [Eumeta japonica]
MTSNHSTSSSSSGSSTSSGSSSCTDSGTSSTDSESTTSSDAKPLNSSRANDNNKTKPQVTTRRKSSECKTNQQKITTEPEKSKCIWSEDETSSSSSDSESSGNSSYNSKADKGGGPVSRIGGLGGTTLSKCSVKKELSNNGFPGMSRASTPPQLEKDAQLMDVIPPVI